ncbi:Nigerythrin [bioreactor metagenome]|uniref:Nigerythrin n=1 Tax=bioreactor metagenome TaxID=1076179 RepID=A0A645AVR9_9ZZZZ
MKKSIYFTMMLVASLLVFASCNQKPVKTIADLKDGIKGETTASAKYAAFAQKAREEGNDTIAKLFDAASRAEAIHAANHTKVLEKLGEKMESFTPEYEVKTTAENLQAAIEGETYEETTMYPQFIKDAEAEKVPDAVKSFTWAMDTEKKHEAFYSNSLTALQSGNESVLPADYEVCPVCGNTYAADKVDENCAFCQTPRDKFEKI